MDAAALREDMVDGLEYGMDLDEAVAVAMRTVPRHEFVPEGPYQNRPSEHEGTTILSPGMVARLLDALQVSPDDTVLVVGAGVGYTAAVLAELVGDHRVQAVDIARRLVWDARQNLEAAGYEGVLVDCRDGADGLPEYAPFDRILVEAAAVRPPRALTRQLASGGRIVMPMGSPPEQQLVALDGEDVVQTLGDVRFKPLLVDGEQSGGITRNRTEREDREFARQGYFAPTGWEQEWIDWDEQL
jgi:protein-L-isoaspartate(D-aspartate) O-methyltransferase